MCKISKEEKIKECSNDLKEQKPDFMTSPQSQKTFQEENPEFYDIEYCLATEYRYFSGAHGSRIENILGIAGATFPDDECSTLDVAWGTSHMSFIKGEHE